MNLSLNTASFDRRRVLSGKAHSVRLASIAAASDLDASQDLNDALAAAPTLETIEEIDVEGIARKAFADGHAVGREQAFAEIVEEDRRTTSAALLEIARQLGKAASDVASAREEILQDVVNEVIDLAFELLQVLVSEELELREDPARDAVQRALRFAPPEESLVVRVHPGSSVDAVELRNVVSGRQVKVIADPSIDVRGCVVEAGPCKIDAQMSSALDRVKDELLALRRSGPKDSDE